MSGKLLDTTVLIDLSRGSTDAADFVDEAMDYGTPLFVSVISAMELIAGCRDKTEVQQARKLIARFALIHLSPVESAAAYDLVMTYSRSHGLSIPDAFIAATALIQGLELATDNDRHFRMIQRLSAARPY
jgi:predicted nucleic acid-binding protein